MYYYGGNIFFKLFLHLSRSLQDSAVVVCVCARARGDMRVRRQQSLLWCMLSVCRSCRSCARLFYVNEQIHFHAWLVCGQPVTNGPGANAPRRAKNSSCVIREARRRCTSGLHDGTEKKGDGGGRDLSTVTGVCPCLKLRYKEIR